MPPPKTPPPQFSLTGRYLIDVRTRLDKTTPNFFHDLDNFKPECHLEDIPSGSMSRFDGLDWAIKRGYTRCSYCFAQ